MVPKQEDIETASTQVWGVGGDREDSFLKSYNSLVFLQTAKKIHKKKNVPLKIMNMAKSMEFAKGKELFFNMMNTNTNGFADVVAFFRFFRFSSLYMEIDGAVQQRMTYEVLA